MLLPRAKSWNKCGNLNQKQLRRTHFISQEKGRSRESGREGGREAGAGRWGRVELGQHKGQDWREEVGGGHKGKTKTFRTFMNNLYY